MVEKYIISHRPQERNVQKGDSEGGKTVQEIWKQLEFNWRTK